MRKRVIIVLLLLLTTAPAVRTYPLDGAAATGIRRLAGYKLVNEGKIKGSTFNGTWNRPDENKDGDFKLTKQSND